MTTLVRCVAALTVCIPAGAAAQDSIAVGLGMSNVVGRGECLVDHCNSLVRSVSGDAAFNITESVAAVVGIGIGVERIGTSVGGIAIDGVAETVTFNGGVRAYGPPGPRRVFAEVLVGGSTGTAQATAFVYRVSGSGFALSISPGAGVDIALGERVAVRLSGGVSLGVSEGAAWGSFGGGVGLVLGVGGGL